MNREAIRAAATGEAFVELRSPASFSQERMWFAAQLFPESSAYNTRVALRLTGELDVDALRRAVDALVARHEALRTTYVGDGESVEQCVWSPRSPAFRVIDLQDHAAGSRDQAALRLAEEFVAQPFDLRSAPPFRTLLIRITTRTSLVVFSIHHIAFDGWSARVFVRDLAALYSGHATSSTPALPSLSVQYADYATWQRQRYVGGAFNEDLAYWREKLRGSAASPDIGLPIVQAQEAAGAAASTTLSIPDSVYRRLTKRAATSNVTPFVFCLACMKALLVRYSQTDDVAVAVPVAGRGSAELEDVIGCFINTVVVRSHLARSIRFADALDIVRRTAFEAYDHQECPFEKVIAALAPPRSGTRVPLVRVLFSWDDVADRDFQFADLRAEVLEVPQRDLAVDLAIEIEAAPRSARLRLDFDGSLYPQSSVERFGRHFLNLLEHALLSPDERIGSLKLMDADERAVVTRRAMPSWRASKKSAVTVDALLDAQARQTPSATALQTDTRRVSYGELAEQSARLARYLRSAGVSPGDAVGVRLPRAPELVTSIFAILKAGAAFVPIDPALPPERARFIATDANVSVIVSTTSYAESLSATNARILLLEREERELKCVAAPPLGSRSDGSGVAYIVYTSGSTGVPIGVPVEHRNVSPLLAWAHDRLEIGRETRLLETLSYGFDGGLFEIFATLCSGGVLHQLEPGISELRSYVGYLRRHAINTILVTPSLLDELVTYGERLRSLDLVIVHGEEPNWDSVRRAQQIFEHCAVVNVYGQPETAIICASHTTRPGDAGEGIVPIGTPAAAARLYVLDPSRDLAPMGVRGELCVGGPGVTRGYLNEPELVRERFMADPLGTSGDVVYATGDLARWADNGTLIFEGRKDGQVKIREVSVGLGEIETVLRRHRDVQAAAATVQDDGEAGQHLVAFVVAAQGATATESELREAVAAAVPDHMVPSRIVSVAQLPRTPTGKLDRSALPRVEFLPSEDAPAQPRTELERKLVTVWEDVLGVSPVGVSDDFFSLGGHSLLAMRLARQIEAVTGQVLRVAALFPTATVERVARLLEADGVSASDVRDLAIVPLSSQHNASARLIFIHPIGGDVFCYARLARMLERSAEVYGIRAVEDESCRDVERIAEAHLERLAASEAREFTHLVGWSFGGIVALEMARKLRASTGESPPVILIDSVLGTLELGNDDAGLRASFEEDIQRMLDASGAAAPATSPLEADSYSERHFSTFRRHVAALREYEPAPFDGRVTLVLSAATARDPRREAAWRDVCTNLVVRAIDGDHYSILGGEDASALAAVIASAVADGR